MLVDIRKDYITDNFKLSEFVNKEDKNRFDFHPGFFNFVDMLQEFRGWYGRPINITSGYRTPSFNKKIGGVSNSLHLQGLAIDFRLPISEFNRYSKARKLEYLTNVKNKWFSMCDERKIKGSVIWYDTFLHIDVRSDFRYFKDERKVK